MIHLALRSPEIASTAIRTRFFVSFRAFLSWGQSKQEVAIKSVDGRTLEFLNSSITRRS